MKKMIAVLLVFMLVLGNWAVAAEEPESATPAGGAVAESEETEEIIEESQFVPTVAVLHFETRSRAAEMDKVGKSISELLFMELLESESIDLVERAELNAALDELHLSATGMTARDSQVKLGQLVGAKILITGSVFESEKKRYAVAKIIGTETGRVKGCSVSGTGEYLDLVPDLAKKVREVLQKDAARLLPRKASVFSVADRLEKLNGNGRKVYLEVKEDIQQSIADPAAMTSLKKLLLSLDFEVVADRSDADFAVICEAVASNAGQYYKFSSAQARVEISVYQVKDNKLLASGARKETVAGATYVIAAKDAINQATLKLAGNVLGELK